MDSLSSSSPSTSPSTAQSDSKDECTPNNFTTLRTIKSFNTFEIEYLSQHTSVNWWTLSDKPSSSLHSGTKLPMASFDHIAREVLDVEISRKFYCEILGFDIVPRPKFECQGLWLSGYGLNLHLVETRFPDDRRLVRMRRIQHFSMSLPRVDHIAFVTHDISLIRKVLSEAKVYIKEDSPEETGIEQIFFFDPDGNVIEISNCGSTNGKISCISTKAAVGVEEKKDDKQSSDASYLSAMSKLRSLGLTDDEIFACIRIVSP